MVLEIERFELLSYQNSLKQRDITLQRKATSQKLLQVALRTVYFRSFTVLASCKSVSTTSLLVTKKFNNQHRQRLSSKFKVNSTCPYICSIRNYNILIYCYACAICTEQYPTTLTNIVLLLHAKRSTRCKNCMIGRLKFDNQHTWIWLQTVIYSEFSKNITSIQAPFLGQKDSTSWKDW